MQVSAEIRWFSRREPENLVRWFCGALSESYEPEIREDCYFRDPGQIEMGIKQRGGKAGVEIKGLVARVESLKVAPFLGSIEIWTKWTSGELVLDASRLVSLNKTRWLRKFDTSGRTPTEPKVDGILAAGCGVELTRVELSGGDEWWTFGFEAFGGLEAVSGSLRRTAQALASQSPPDLAMEMTASYPEWLAHCIRNAAFGGNSC